MRTALGFLMLLVLAGLLATSASAQDDRDRLREAGRRIYEEGILGSGEPLVGRRGEKMLTRGRQAACVGCHQRSGFGQLEASKLIPSVTAYDLFSPDRKVTPQLGTGPGIRAIPAPHLARPAYDDQSLAIALREGVRAGGGTLDYLMPRYALDEQDMQALTSYLRTLSANPSPGSTPAGTHFATVIASGQSAALRAAVIDVLQACFAEKNRTAQGPDAWSLDVWDLEGAPQTWDAQLAAKYKSKPAFALISGLGGAEWKPIDAFCNANKVPCLFPNVDVPGEAREGGMIFYFSRGVLLEADAILRQIMDSPELSITRIVQVVGRNAAAVEAAKLLADRAKGKSLETETLSFAGSSRPWSIRASDAVVLWLSEDEMRALAKAPVPPAAAIFVSGWLAGFEKMPLPLAWKAKSIIVLPVDAPVRRTLRTRYTIDPWLKAQGLSLVDPTLQGNTLAACKIVTETSWRMRGKYHRDYLVEFIENYPTGMGNAPAAQAYPRFVASPGQRVTSRGVFLARFSKKDPREMELARDWFVP